MSVYPQPPSAPRFPPTFNTSSYESPAVSFADLADLVTLDTTQTLTGFKIFSSAPEMSSILSGGGQAVSVPNTVGTMALTSQLPPSGTNRGDFLFWDGVNYVSGDTNVVLGGHAGETGQQAYASAIGWSAGATNQGTYAIALGWQSGQGNQGTGAISIGFHAGETDQNANGIAIGTYAGQTGQGTFAVSLGYQAGASGQGQYGVAIGYQAGRSGQNTQSVAIGYRAGETNQGQQSVAIGYQAGFNGQNSDCVAIGMSAGSSGQALGAIAVGFHAGQSGQNQGCVAIGYASGESIQGTYAVAMGYRAGQTGQGADAVAIGYGAGQSSQPSNSIIINASGSLMNPSTGSACYINPIRSNGTGVLSPTVSYDTTSGEIYLNTTKTFVIDHPLDAKRHLVHGCLEGPESAVYQRGKEWIDWKTKSTIIELPNYCKVFNNWSVHLTPIGAKGNLYTSDVMNNKFTVYGEPVQFNWLAIGRRSTINAEPLKNEVQVKGEPPYLSIEPLF